MRGMTLMFFMICLLYCCKETTKTNHLVAPAGELQRRIQLTQSRFAAGTCPSFTPEFILSDVALQPKRRFNEFSGDLSGRYIETAARMPFPSSVDTRQLVLSALKYQKSDGRFGDESLAFRADVIGPAHMALLWGNGRLLIGLLEAYRAYQDPAILQSAHRLGDFLVTVGRECAAPKVRHKLAGKGAFGFICFTQQVEGLVTLAHVTSDSRYLEAARFVAPLLESRGIQHSHGYLATLRGILMLAAAVKSTELQQLVETKYADLVSSSDFTIFGSVLEYFGWFDPQHSAGDFAALQQASGQDPRDEGCGHADFLRLSLALWQATDRYEYLERAEACMYNALFMNQYPSGDFGSKVTFHQGMKPAANIDRAWWCCTMHGYRAFDDVLNNIITRVADGIAVNLYVDADWSDEKNAVKIRSTVNHDGTLCCRLEIVENRNEPMALIFRQPAWAEPVSLLLNGEEISAQRTPQGARLNRSWRKGDRVEAHMLCKPRLALRDGRWLSPGQLEDRPVEAALFFGPWLMGVCENIEPLFFGEPWQGNRVQLSLTPESNLHTQGPRLRTSYHHDSFPGIHDLVLCPVSEYSQWDNCTLAVWLNYSKAIDSM